MMDQVVAEKRLAITYVLCVIVGATASITTGVAWGHWKLTLDQCGGTQTNGRNCSCILYGQHTPSKFLGGEMAPCIWVTFGPLIYVLFCIGLTCFHGYRVLFATKSPRMRTTRSVIAKMEPSGEAIQVQAISEEDTSPLPKAFWIIASTLSVFFALYALIHFAIFLDGFYKTCNQYRKTLEQLLGLHGTALPVIHGRLACQGIFDFMDYMQLDSGNAYRNGFINTGLDLMIGIVASGFSWVLFINSSFLNIKMAQRKND